MASYQVSWWRGVAWRVDEFTTLSMPTSRQQVQVRITLGLRELNDPTGRVLAACFLWMQCNYYYHMRASMRL